MVQNLVFNSHSSEYVNNFITDTFNIKEKLLTIECCVSGEPAPNVVWFKDGILLSSSDKYQMIDDGDDLKKLLIRRATADDSGRYICQAENLLHKEETSHYVYLDNKTLGVSDEDNSNRKRLSMLETSIDQVETRKAGVATTTKSSIRNKIVFESILKDITVEDGYPVKFVCNVRGQDPIVEWYKGKELLDNCQKYRMSNRNGIISLEIIDVCSADSGEYACVVRNLLNEVKSIGRLRVIDSREIPPTFTRNLKGTCGFLLLLLQ